MNTICPELVDTPMALALGEASLKELRKTEGILRLEGIEIGLVKLIEDDSRAGAVMQIAFRDSQEYITT